jgi:AcrR family transcriptional regulator
MTEPNTTSAAGLPTRERLAAEAARMFAQRGYHGTSLRGADPGSVRGGDPVR